uniref:Immunoglobulin V-set domain-containing protein n=1 Tax=Equus caballus TaxID=9796 RepID=A0A3Q2HRE4_HORSE
ARSPRAPPGGAPALRPRTRRRLRPPALQQSRAGSPAAAFAVTWDRGPGTLIQLVPTSSWRLSPSQHAPVCGVWTRRGVGRRRSARSPNRRRRRCRGRGADSAAACARGRLHGPSGPRSPASSASSLVPRCVVECKGQLVPLWDLCDSPAQLLDYFDDCAVSWVYQAPQKALQRLSSINCNGDSIYDPDSIKGQFTISRDNAKNTVYLQMKRLRAGDTAFCYCVSDRVMRSQCELIHKPPGSKRRGAGLQERLRMPGGMQDTSKILLAILRVNLWRK